MACQNVLIIISAKITDLFKRVPQEYQTSFNYPHLSSAAMALHYTTKHYINCYEIVQMVKTAYPYSSALNTYHFK